MQQELSFLKSNFVILILNFSEALYKQMIYIINIISEKSYKEVFELKHIVITSIITGW